MSADNSSSGSMSAAEIPAMSPDVPTGIVTHLAALAAAVEALAGYDIAELDGPEALAVDAALSSAVSRLSVVGARVLAMVEADGFWAAGGGAASFSTWVASRHGVGVSTAKAQVRLARALRDHLPVTAAAATAGEISVEHAHVLARYAPTTQARRDALADPESPTNEAWLVQAATSYGVDAFRRVVRYWAAAADPDADDRGYVDAADREYLEVAQTLDGSYHLRGQLTVDHGQALTQALAAVTPVPAAGDQRTSSQRRAQALGDLARLTLDHGLTGTGRAIRPRIGVLVDYPTLVDLAARAAAQQDGDDVPPATSTLTLTPESVLNAPKFEDGTLVPRILLDRLACDSQINRYVFGPDSEILDVGRTERTFTGPRRSAIIARDKHCRYPGCTAPPAISEGHHVQHWSRDHGDTTVDNGILLCWYHHDHVHRRNINIRWTTNGWVFERDGIRIDTADNAQGVA